MSDSEQILFEYQFRVDESHLDTFGHMNHATYLTMYEQARWDFITERGFGLKEIMETQTGPTILEAKIKYKRELKLRENIRIQTVHVEWDGKMGEVKQRMLNEDGKVCSELKLLLGFFDMKKRKLVNASKAWRHALGAKDD